MNKWRFGLTGLGIFSALSTLWSLQNGQRSEYYAAIATSMSKNVGNFFFGALDPAGTVTLDKIPGSYWIPAIFVRIFGVHTWSFNAPNAIATVAAVLIVAHTFKKLVGPTGGLIAGFIYGTTPIVVAVGRSNQPQSFFLLALALVMWRAAIAFETLRRKDLVIAGAMIALAFHTYMLEAWAVWPALIVAWFFTNKKLKEKFLDLLIAGSSSLALSLSWILIVFLVPKTHRPYIGGTYHNNPFEMVFGYNGLGRFTSTSQALSSTSDDPIFRSFTPPFGGQAGWGRFFNYQVAGQISWLIPAAVLSIVVALIAKRHKALVVFLAMWFATFFVMLSQVAGIHQFYVSSLAFPIAGLIALAYADIHERGRDWLFAIILGSTALWAVYLSNKYQGYFDKSSYFQAAIAVVGISVLFAQYSRVKKLVIPILLISGLALTPATWALDTVNHPSSINPIAGPDTGMGGGFGGRPMGAPNGNNFNRGNFPPPGNNGFDPRQRGFDPDHGAGYDRPQFDPNNRPNFGARNFGGGNNSGGGFGQQDNSELITYLKKNRGGAKFFLVAFGGTTAAPYITQSQDNVLPVGGFDGSDPTPTLSTFKKLVTAGDVKYVLVGGRGGRGPGGNTGSSSEITQWVQSSCSVDSAAPVTNLYICSA